MKSLRRCLAVLGVVVLPSLLGAQDVPFLNGRVNDLAGLIPDDREEALESRLEAFELETGSQVVVLTVPDLGGDSDAAYASRVAEAWALGREGVNDGVLFLIARDDRKLRIEVGYGLEGALTDAESRRILDWIAVPAFRDGDFARGIEDATLAVLEEIRGEAPVPQGAPAWMTEDLERQRAQERRAGWVSVVVFALFILFLIRMGRRRGRRRRAWSSRTGWGRPPSGDSPSAQSPKVQSLKPPSPTSAGAPIHSHSFRWVRRVFPRGRRQIWRRRSLVRLVTPLE